MGWPTDGSRRSNRRRCEKQPKERIQMDRSIVCGVDGSADSRAALAVAGDLAARLRLRLIVANVVQPSHGAYVGAASLGGALPRPPLSTIGQEEEAANGATRRAQRDAGARTGRSTRRHRLSSRRARRPCRRGRSSADRRGLAWPRRIQGGVPRQRLDHVDRCCTLPRARRAAGSSTPPVIGGVCRHAGSPPARPRRCARCRARRTRASACLAGLGGAALAASPPARPARRV